MRECSDVNKCESFMPSVKEITEKSPKWSNLRSTLDLRYDVPWFWFEYLGWNFNGFYTGQAKTVGNDGGIKHSLYRHMLFVS